MANTISESNRLHKTYVPVKLAAVLEADAARLRGREKNKTANKVTTPPAKKLQPDNSKASK